MYENNNGSYQSAPQQAQNPSPEFDPAVDSYVDAAFSKSLAATIMCGFPVASIIAISFGSAGLDLVENAKRLAATRGVKTSGKIVAATVLGKIGKIAGIVMTAFWGFYLLMLIIIMAGM